MADHFEQAKDDILTRTEGNGGPTPRDLLLALGALASDADDQHAESVKETAALRSMLDVHLKEAAVRDRRIGKVEAKIAVSERECPERVKQAIEAGVRAASVEWRAEHHKGHNEYVASISTPHRKDDSKKSDYRQKREESRQVWLMWMVGSKVTYVLLAAIITAINLGLHYLFMGNP